MIIVSMKMMIAVSFWFFFDDFVFIYMYAYVFVWLYLNLIAVYIVSLHIGHDSWYAVSSTHQVAPQHTLGPPVL